MDFDWPIGETWEGYLLPASLEERECPDCGGDGYTAEARAVAETFYPHMIGGGDDHACRLAWHDKLGQSEVDHLVSEGRLRTWVRDDSERGGHWASLPRLAAEVNAEQRGGLGSHDAINRGILIGFRCERLGIQVECSTCEGHGTLEAYPGQRAEAEEWEEIDPPTGEGWQMWETTSEGSPRTPVFSNAEELADYCARNVSVFGSKMGDREQWLSIIKGADFAHVEIAPGVILM